MTPCRRSLRLAALLLALGTAGTALAQPLGQPARGSLSPEQWQRVFPEHRQLALRDHQARIAILRRGESCIRAARDAGAMLSCKREERRAFQDHRRRHKAELRRLFESRGIPLPEWGRRSGRPGRGGAG
jgi:hypothetical protein